MAWQDRDSTTAPTVGESEDESPSGSYPGVLEKMLRGRIPTRPRPVFIALILGWLVFVSWVFLQDNAAGGLKDCSALWWFATKMGFYSLFALIGSALIGLVLLFTRNPKEAPTAR